MSRLIPDCFRRADLIAPAVRETLRALVRGDLPWPLFMHGGPGCGKSCSALSLLDYVDGSAFYYTTSGWVNEVIAVAKGQVSWKGEGGSVPVNPGMLERRIRGAKLIVLDELASRDRVPDWHYEAVKDLIDWRDRKPLIVISNHPPQSVEAIYDSRIVDRLSKGTVIQIAGNSRRRAKQPAKQPLGLPQ